MGVSIYIKGRYEDFLLFWRQKNKANSKPNKANLLAFSVLRSVDSVKMRKRNLKKQSQFGGGQNIFKPAQTMTYGDFGGRRLRKNKANFRKGKINTNSFLKGNYGNKSAGGVEENKANFKNLQPDRAGEMKNAKAEKWL